MNSLFYIVGIVITFFLAAILISKKDKIIADKILSFWLLTTGVHLILYYSYFTQTYAEYPYFLGLEIPLPLLHGPFLYLYTYSLTVSRTKTSTYFIHFIAPILTIIILIPFFVLPLQQKIVVYQNDGKGYERLMQIIQIGYIVSGVLYIVLSLFLLKQHKKNIENQFSYSEKINLKWLRYLILGSAIIWLVVILGNDEAIYSTVVLYVLFIGYFGIKQVGIFTNQQPHTPFPSEELAHELSPVLSIPLDSEPPKTEKALEHNHTIAKIKYSKSGLQDDTIQLIHQKLTVLMTHDKLYKSPELTLSELAGKLDVHPNNLSQVINTVEQKNFYDYINLLRVDEFKTIAQVETNQKYTLLSLAYECGFNSKTSFNRNFKKVTGLSPSDYLKQINNNHIV